MVTAKKIAMATAKKSRRRRVDPERLERAVQEQIANSPEKAAYAAEVEYELALLMAEEE